MFTAVCLLATTLASAQVELQRPYSSHASHFFFQALNFRSPSNQSRIDYYFQVPYSQLHFIKSGNSYTAQYTITVRLVDRNDNTVVEESWDERAISAEFSETESDKVLSSSQRHFKVMPGTYRLISTMSEKETEGSVTQERGIVARDFASPSVSVSDIMLLLSSSSSGGRLTIIPNIQGNVVSSSDSFPVFYEIYTARPGDSVYATTEIAGVKDVPVYSSSRWIFLPDSVNAVFQNIPKHTLSMNDYRLAVTLRGSADETAAAGTSAVVPFSIHFIDLPPTITDLDKAIEEMMFVASSSTIDSIMAAPDDVTKEKRFLRFWDTYKCRFSQSGRVSMAEYFNRVDYANKNFTHFFPGWKSDRGMVYILFGPPDNVDRRPFNIDVKPYEVWYYYQKDRRFTFLDDSGFGDYKLLNRIWDNNSPLSGMDFTKR